MITVRLLGPVEAEVGGSTVALTRPLERALLARLALDVGQSVSDSRLVDDLWGDHIPRDAVGSLQGLVYRLRSTLRPEGHCIVRSGNGYALDAGAAQVDLDAFTHLLTRARAAAGAGDVSEVQHLLRRALDLWRAAPLGGVVGTSFAGAQSIRLEALRRSALGERLDADLALGRHGEIVAELESLVVEHPFEERFWAQLMLARYRAGSQADALRCFSRLRTVLNDELGLEPGPTVAALEQAILRQDTELDWVPGGGLAALVGHRLVTGSPGRPPFAMPAPKPTTRRGRSDLSWVGPAGPGGFVGRVPECGQLRSARRRAARGERVLVLVTGEPGIGKTRFVAEMAREFDDAGDLVLHGRWDEEPLAPYQAFRQALGRYVEPTPRDAVLAEVGPLLGVLAQVVPELVQGREPQAPDVQADHDKGGGDRYLVFDAVRRWVDAIGTRRPLVLVLDDLHWADRPSLLLLQYLLRSLAPGRVLVVATYRPTECGVPGWYTTHVAGVRRTAYVEDVALGALSTSETQALAEAALGRQLSEDEAAGSANLQRRTGGNPFFLEQVVRDLGSGRVLAAWSANAPDQPCLPDRLRDVVHWRLRQLSAPCRAVLSMASVMGEQFDVGAVGRAVDADDETLLRALDEARAAGVVHDGTSGYDTQRFAHPVVRQALYEDLGHSRRTRMKRRLATALAAATATPPPTAGPGQRHIPASPTPSSQTPG